MADELNPRQMWEIVNKLELLDKKLDRADSRIEGIVQVLDGIGQQAGIRQQLRELRHYVEGNPPAVRGIIKELETLNHNYNNMHADLNARHDKLRKDFEDYVEQQGKASATQQGTIGGARLVWGLIASAVTFLGILATLLVQIQNALSRGGG